jgi:membrane associated rhomboid family serine protease
MSSQLGYLLVTIAFYAAFGASMLARRNRVDRQGRRVPVALLAVFAVTAVFSLLQVPFPGVLEALQRNPDRLAGEWWQLVTPLLVQDGGLAGTAANLTALALLGYAGAQWWSTRRWLILYFGTGVAAEIVAYAWLRQGFAGNSIAVCGLAAGLALTAATAGEGVPVALAGLSLLSGLILLLGRDLHGAAYAIGMVLAWLTAHWAPGDELANVGEERAHLAH